VIINEDEEGKRYREDKMATIPPAFSKTGTITAANASKINDGACAVRTSIIIQLSLQRKRLKNWA